MTTNALNEPFLAQTSQQLYQQTPQYPYTYHAAHAPYNRRRPPGMLAGSACQPSWPSHPRQHIIINNMEQPPQQTTRPCIRHGMSPDTPGNHAAGTNQPGCPSIPWIWQKSSRPLAYTTATTRRVVHTLCCPQCEPDPPGDSAASKLQHSWPR